MAAVSRGKDAKPEQSLWDSEPEESSLPMLSSSAIELVHDSPEPVIEKSIVEDPAEVSFFEITNDSKSASSLSDPLVLAGVAPKRSSRLLPWLLLVLTIALVVAASVEVVKPRFDALAQAEARLADTGGELATSRARVQALEEKLAALETEKTALITERDALAVESQKLEEKKKAAEELAERLRTAFANEKRIEVAMLEDAIALRMTTDDVFVFGDVTLKDPAFLDAVALVLKGQGEHRYTISAHTDSTPVPSKLRARFPSNYELSAARAFAVLHQLESHKLSDRIDVIAAGATQPIASNRSQSGRRKNRRIEIVIR